MLLICSIRIRNMLTALIFAGVVVAMLSGPVMGQNCSCSSNLCCSQYGYCGTGDAYCGVGCQEGPCQAAPPTNNVDVSGIVTDRFFNRIINQAAKNCTGRGFYTRQAFIDALGSYSSFGRVGTVDDSKREIAAFFAHVTHETGHFCYIEEINGASNDYCDKNNTQYPCAPGKKYYGRGPIQLSWNFNYGPAGKSLGLNLLTSPETVAEDPVVSFKTALWYWMDFVQQALLNKGFGETIRAINGAIECNGGNPDTVKARVGYYLKYCKQLRVSPGGNLTC